VSSVYERFRDICLELPETSEVFVATWGHPTFRVGPKLKMFASCSANEADRPALGMKVDLAHQAALAATDPRYRANRHGGMYGWITVDASGELDWDEIRELVQESYCLNAPKRLARMVRP
jgi:predicted DNA-binding protein (MmcQ/YjbR family)